LDLWIVVRLAGCLVAWLVCCCLVVGWLSCLVRLVGWLAGWFGSTRQRLVPSPGAFIVKEVGGGQAQHKQKTQSESPCAIAEASVVGANCLARRAYPLLQQG